MIDFAVDDLHFARRAEAVAAGVRQIYPRTQAGIEDGLAILDVHGNAQRLDRQLVGHRLSARPFEPVEAWGLKAQAVLMAKAVLFEALLQIGRPGLA